jgi:Protein of unknown function (DUF3040)
MPLSEHEQRILAELEESLTKQDPSFAKSVADTNVYAVGRRRLQLAIAGFVVGLVVLVAFFSQNVLAGLVGVALMFASAIVAERSLRLLGRASWHDLTRGSAEGETEAGSPPRLRSMRAWLADRRRSFER